MDVSPYLLVRKLVVKGVDSAYTASFREGLNIIWGDMDCGKSTILNLIDYCLGGKNDDLLYEELKAKGRVALLEVDLNGTICTFERSIAHRDEAIRVYMCGIIDAVNTFPMLMSGSSGLDMPDGWVSDFILDQLGIPKVRIKESRYRDDSGSDRLSFRDLMKLIYLKQTKVGADSLLDFGASAVFNKNVEVQKFVYNIHDDKISALNQDLAAEARELSQLKDSRIAVSKFLSDVQIPVHEMVSEEAIQPLESDLEQLEESAISLKKDYEFASELAISMANDISSLKLRLSDVGRQVEDNRRKYKSFSSLRATYDNDLECLSISKIARGSISRKLLEKHRMLCPLCRSDVDLTSEFIDDDVIDAEAKSIKNRVSGLQNMLDETWSKIEALELEKESISGYLKARAVEFDKLNIENISSLLASIEAIERQKLEVRVSMARLKRDLAISNKYEDLAKRIDGKEAVVSRLKSNIKIVEGSLVGLDEVVIKLSGRLNYYLKRSALQNVKNAYFDKKFVPYFRGISYYHTSSGGVRTVISILSFVSRLRYLLDQQGNLPTFLMVDTPGQNIGRNERKDEDSEISDPAVYDNIFKRLNMICRYAKRNSRKCQVIVVDNDLPDFLVRGKDYHLVKRFSKSGGEFEKGFVNDY